MGSSPWSNQIISEIIVVTQPPANNSSGGILVYNSSIALGTLIASIWPNSSTDTVGNTIAPGITSYLPTGASSPVTAASLEGGQVDLLSAPTPNTPFASWTVFGSIGDDGLGNAALSVKGSAIWECVAPFQIQDYMQVGQTATPPSALAGYTGAYTDSNDVFRLIDALGNLGVGMTMQKYSTGNQLINSTTPVVIGNNPGGFAWEVEAGANYYLKLLMFYTGTAAAGAPVVGVDGGSVVSAVNVWTQWLTGGAVFSVGGYVLGTFSNMTGPTLNTGNNMFYLEGFFSCTTSGVFNLRAQEGTAGDSWAIKGAGAALIPV